MLHTYRRGSASQLVAPAIFVKHFLQKLSSPSPLSRGEAQAALSLGEIFVESVAFAFNDLGDIGDCNQGTTLVRLGVELEALDASLVAGEEHLPRGEFGFEVGDDFGGGVHIFLDLGLGVVATEILSPKN